MGYYGRRKRYGGYRRYRRRASSGGGGGNPIAVFVVLIIAGVILTGGRILGAIILLILSGVTIYAIYKLVKWIVTTPVSVNTKLNFTHHTQRDFFEGTNEGEFEVANTLASGLDHEKYYIFNNVTIPSQLYGSSQIDHIVVSRSGIFVIETKDYKGWIFGGSNQKEWTQSLPGGRKKFQFSNPLWQNWGHIQSLKGIFPNITEDKFKSIVVFTDTSEFKTSFPENVMNVGALVAYITKFQTQIVPEEIIYTVVGKLTYRAHTNNISASKHIGNINTYHSGSTVSQ